MKIFKSVMIPLLNGSKKRIAKADVICVNEQENIMGG